MLEHLKEHDEWFNAFWDLEELLLGLEAFDLLHAEDDGAKTVYRLTPNGHKIVAEQQGKSTGYYCDRCQSANNQLPLVFMPLRTHG